MNMRMMFGTIAAAVVLAGCVSGPKVDNTPVSALDLNRYLGEWYEIARFDHSFERGESKTASRKRRSGRERRQTRPDSCASRSSARSTPTTA